MIIERELENKLISELSALFEDDNIQFVGSRSVTEDGKLLTEKDNVKTIIAVGTGYRSHDAFSLPMIDIKVSLVICTRIELDPTATYHENLIEKLTDVLSYWHFKGVEMEYKLSTEKFVAGELRLTGGSGRITDKTNNVWSDTINFEIRGTQIFNN